MSKNALPIAIVALALCSVATAADYGLKEGAPGLKSAGSIAFGPDGVLFVGDAKSATIFALDTGDKAGDPSKVSINVAGIESKIAAALSVDAVTVNDMAANPISGTVFFSVTAGGKPAIVKVGTDGSVSPLSLKKIAFAKAELADAPADKEVQSGRRKRNLRGDSITDLFYADGSVLVSGASNQASTASIREFAFPFMKSDPGIGLEIFHAAHGRVEDNATPRVFVPFNVGGEPSVLAGFVCTPLVQFPIKAIEPGKKVRGKTVAEVGNRNRPLDMIAYDKDSQDWLLIANSARGVMKVSTQNIAKQQGLNEKVSGGKSAGLKYETIESMKGVAQLDRLNRTHAVVLVKAGNGHDLKTVPLP